MKFVYSLMRLTLLGFLIAASLRADAPAQFKSLGIGLGGFNYYTAGPFANTMMTGGDWLEFGPSEWGSSVIAWNNPQFDSNGYPKYLNTNKKLRMLMWPYGGGYGNRPATWPRRDGQGFGKVVLTWQGDADIRLAGGTYLGAESSGASTGRLVNGRRVYRYTANSMSNLTVEEINAANPVTNIAVWLPDPADPQNKSLEGKFWHPTFIQRLQDFDLNHIRMMDWGDTNQSPQQDWSDRRLPVHRSQHGLLNTRAPANGFTGNRPTGICWEYMISLANTLNRDVWLCVPHLATDDYVTNLANLVRYGSDGVNPYTSAQASPVFAPLNPNLRVYVEYSNEIWSSGNSFPQGNWAQDQANALGITKPRFNARRFCQIWSKFQAIFGGSERIVRVAAIFTGSSSYSDPFLQEIKNYGPTLTPAVAVDVVSPTTYFGNGIQDWAYQTAITWRGTANQWFLTSADFTAGSTTRPVSVAANDAYWTSTKFASDQATGFNEWKRRIFSGSNSQGGGFDTTGMGGGYDDSVRTMIQTIFGRPVPLVSYEGGPSLYSDYLDGGDARDDGITTFMEAMNRRSEFAEIYRVQMNMAAAKGLRSHSLFVDVSLWGKYGQWGHLEYPDQNPLDSVKWQAMLAHEADMKTIRHVDDLLGTRPQFTTAPVLPTATYLQTYSADIVVTGGEYGIWQKPNFTLVSSLLSTGLTVAPVTGDDFRLRVRGVPTQGGPNYLYIRVTDGDGDPAWRVFSFYVAGGAGTLVESDFTGTNPALNLPWTKTLTKREGLGFSGWQRGLAYTGSGGTVGGRGVNVYAANNGIKFSVDQGSQNESDSTLASALADDEYWKLTVTPVAGTPLSLRKAEVRFTHLRDEYHTVRNWAVFTSIGGYSAAAAVYTAPRTTSMGESVEYVFQLPDTVDYQNLTTPVELRFYPYGSQYAHKATLTGFKLTEASTTTLPDPFVLWQQALPWNGASNASADDADGDGLSNLLEYALGTNPLLASSTDTRFLGAVAASEPMQFTFVRIADPKLTYIVEATDDLSLATWPTVLYTSTGAANVAGMVTVSDIPNVSTTARFIRLRVVLP
ncbi:MAG: thrombospondin type 3 repeat-containing protein [Verrucomicrobiota bacterium]|nr:thrombospondin type 3 repeat-containing protein [Verrucomicrobiota bacterium]